MCTGTLVHYEQTVRPHPRVDVVETEQVVLLGVAELGAGWSVGAALVGRQPRALAVRLKRLRTWPH
jgi:hypothetical protein